MNLFFFFSFFFNRVRCIPPAPIGGGGGRRQSRKSIGFNEPDDISIASAIEANDAFIERREAIRDEAGQTIDDDD